MWWYCIYGKDLFVAVSLLMISERKRKEKEKDIINGARSYSNLMIDTI